VVILRKNNIKKNSLIQWFSYLEKSAFVLFGFVLFLIILRGSNNTFGILKLTDRIYTTGERRFKRHVKQAYDAGEIDEYDGREMVKNYQEDHWFRYGLCKIIVLLQGTISICLAVFTTHQLYKKYRLLRFRERLWGNQDV